MILHFILNKSLYNDKERSKKDLVYEKTFLLLSHILQVQINVLPMAK